MNYCHDWEEDQDSNQSCTKCGAMRGYFNWYEDNCPKPDKPVKEPYIETVDYTFKTDDEVRQILSGGNRSTGAER